MARAASRARAEWQQAPAPGGGNPREAAAEALTALEQSRLVRRSRFSYTVALPVAKGACTPCLPPAQICAWCVRACWEAWLPVDAGCVAGFFCLTMALALHSQWGASARPQPGYSIYALSCHCCCIQMYQTCFWSSAPPATGAPPTRSQPCEQAEQPIHSSSRFPYPAACICSLNQQSHLGGCVLQVFPGRDVLPTLRRAVVALLQAVDQGPTGPHSLLVSHTT